MSTSEQSLAEWKQSLQAKGYQITTTIWNYEDREVPFEIVWPPEGSEEESNFIQAFADFLWSLSLIEKGSSR